MYSYIIVDDEEIIRKGTQKKISYMEQPPVCIGEASNGEEAMELIKDMQPDIVIMDMDMPVLDGIGLLTFLNTYYPSIIIIVISGYENFHYAQKAIESNAINYILKPFSREKIHASIYDAIKKMEKKQFQSKLELENKIQYDRHLLRNLILGHYTGTEIDTDRSLITNSVFRSNLTLLMIVTSPNNKLDLSSFEQSSTRTIVHPIHTNIGFIVLFYENELLEKQSQLSSCLKAVQLFSTECFVGISKNKKNITDLHEAYKECITALNQRYLRDNVVHFHYAVHHNPSVSINEWNKVDECLFFIESGNTAQLQIVLTSLFDFFESKDHSTFYMVKYYCLTLAEKTKSLLNDYFEIKSNLTLPQLYEMIYYSEFDYLTIKKYFTDFFLNICKAMSSEKIYQSNDVIENIKTYIQKNYYKEISLEYISEIFFLNKSYCSSLFKERTGVKFVDYITFVRIEKAKELLDHSGRKIYQVSKAVGYDNPKYFFRVFKKYTGLTPEQYKKRSNGAPSK